MCLEPDEEILLESNHTRLSSVYTVSQKYNIALNGILNSLSKTQYWPIDLLLIYSYEEQNVNKRRAPRIPGGSFSL